MENFLTIISQDTYILFSVSFGLIFILFMMNISNRIKFKRLKAKYNRFMSGMSDGNMEQLLERCLDKVNEVNVKNSEIENHLNNIERKLFQCIQKVGIVRYNAFDNVGSDLSFSIAFLDNNDDGIVISGLYSRESSLTYAKPVTGGKSKYALSAEEIQALDIAKKSNREKMYT